jgi:hypothetical protein
LISFADWHIFIEKYTDLFRILELLVMMQCDMD